MNFRFILRGTPDLVRFDAASVELNVLTYVYGPAASIAIRVRFYSYDVCVPCALVAAASAMPQMRENMSATRTYMTTIHRRGMDFVCILASLCNFVQQRIATAAALSSLHSICISTRQCR